MEYKDTLNLPKTSFSMKADLKKLEPRLQKRWDEIDLYGLVRRTRSGNPRYTLHDGPPYPTGDLHIGTGMNKILKDTIVRYKTMRGFDAPFIPGWDCHGLPIEHKVMTELGDKAKGLSGSEIRRKCGDFAEQYVETNRRQFKSLGCIGQWEEPYLTVNPSYEAAVIETFGKLVAGGYVYRELRPIHWCMRCRTALAEAELEYSDEEDNSIYVALRVVDGAEGPFGPAAADGVSLLVWTTTPWTLPANCAVAVHPKFDYALVRYPSPAGKKLGILAEGTLDRVKELLGGNVEVLATAKGIDLTSIKYAHPLADKTCPVILADYVNLEDGTGCVHTAPGHGLEDYASGRQNGLPIISPVDAAGCFTDEAGKFAGLNVFDANPKIIEKLENDGIMIKVDTVTHSYPHCWRCKEPVIFRATEQWFVGVDHEDLRRRALEEITKVKWIPEWGQKRIQGMVEVRPDWCISRQRYWGVPIPVFYCAECGEPLLSVDVISRVENIFAHKGANAWFDGDIERTVTEGWKCFECEGTRFVKETDIFDVWFESGSSHRAVVMNRDDLDFPADLYLEGSDQHRGWFQLSLIPAVAAENCAPYKSVLTHGFVVDENGQKMSKSLGNFMSVEDALDEFSADVLRLWFSSVDYRNDIGVSKRLISRMSDSYRRIRNTFRFLLANLYDFDYDKNAVAYENMREVDRWALGKLYHLARRTQRAYDEFEFHRVYHDVHSFCALDMSSLYMDIRKDTLYTFAADSPERRSAQTAMHRILTVLVRLLAPILVHTTDEVWQNMEEEIESVHLALWPELLGEWDDTELMDKWERLLRVRSEVTRRIERAREEEIVGNSLQASVTLHAESDDLRGFLRDNLPALPELFIVSEVALAEAPPQDAAAGIDMPDVHVAVEKCAHPKCERCWNYADSVGKNTEHPTICARCVRHIT